MAGVEIIENACRQIMVALKEGRFTKNELEVLLKLFQQVVRSTEKLLSRLPNPPDPQKPAGGG